MRGKRQSKGQTATDDELYNFYDIISRRLVKDLSFLRLEKRTENGLLN
jgi:hypothetical protein